MKSSCTPSMVTKVLALFATTVCAIATDQQIDGNLEIVQGLQLRGDALMEGSLSLGKLHTQLPGMKIEVKQAVDTIEVEDITLGHFENQSVWVDVYGEITSGGGQTYVQDYGDVTQSQWVEEYGPITQEVWVEDYGTTSVPVWEDEYGEIPGQPTEVPAVYDEQGNLISEAYTVPGTPTNGVIGGHWSTEESYGVIGGHMESFTTTGIVGGHMVETTVWGVVGGHMEGDAASTTYGIIGSEEQTREVWVPESRSSHTETKLGVPIISFTGQEMNSVWSWKNQDKELMELSSAGLSLPKPYETSGNNRAVLTSTEFEQSFTDDDQSTGNYLSYGVKVAKDGIRAWNDEGSGNVVSSSYTAAYKPQEVIFRKTEPSNGSSSTESRSTRIAATDAEFGGNVAVKGVLRVTPAGDVSMGEFTHGPQP